MLFLNRAPATLDFRPYDLVVVQVSTAHVCLGALTS